MNLGAAKRLRKELLNLERPSTKTNRNDQDEDVIYLRPSSASSILRWTAKIRGPPDTPFAGGIYGLSIVCGSDYPLSPPTIKFDTSMSVGTINCTDKIFHPNIHFQSGEICLDILRREWSPAW
mmetsp:Transcript_22870/g.52399  ORF Transcript_22870/g.52399 Transcript_22870/m.52399 type:complete len:123 (+) Transcript_22870:42-410(+)